MRGRATLIDALKHTALTVVELNGVNDVLRDDPSDNVANYAKKRTAEAAADQRAGPVRQPVADRLPAISKTVVAAGYGGPEVLAVQDIVLPEEIRGLLAGLPPAVSV